jgi:hypothetical protein
MVAGVRFAERGFSSTVKPLPDELFCIIGLGKIMNDLDMLSVVALLEELPEKSLRRGQVGTIVEALAPGVHEVEFCDDAGRSYASVALRSDQLMRLHHQPSHQAA